MTIDKFRKIALEIPTSVERSHMNHPDFRVAGKVFASLGVPDESWGMVKLTPEQQRAFIKKASKIFKPCSGAWGRQGYTNVYLRLRESEHRARGSRRCGEECCPTSEEKFAIARERSVRAGLALARGTRALTGTIVGRLWQTPISYTWRFTETPYKIS